MSTGVPSSSAAAQQATHTSAPSTSDLGIESTNISTAAGVNLSAQQNVLVGSVLDVSNSNMPLPTQHLTNL